MVPLSIAAAQTLPRPGDVDGNLVEHTRLARLAAAGGARAVVFPELSLTGYELELAAALAFGEDDPRLDPLRELARSEELALVVGAPVRIDGALAIGAFVLTPDGDTDVYTKHHLGAFPASANPGGTVPPAEDTVFCPGKRDPLLHVGEHTAALAICADTGRPAHAEHAAGRGAQSYLASMFVIPSDLDVEEKRLRTYAREHAMVTVLANFGGPTGGLPSAGRSAVWSETGELVVQLGPDGSGVAIATRDGAGWTGVTVVGSDSPDR